MRRTAGRVLLALVMLALLVAVGGLAREVRADDAEQRAPRQALAAAEEAARAVLSYDHRTVEEDVTAAQESATGTFLEEYRASTAELAEQAKAGQAVVDARVQAASVVSGGRDRVVVLLFVDQRTTRKDLPEPRVDQARLRLTMEPVDGDWRIARLDAL